MSAETCLSSAADGERELLRHTVKDLLAEYCTPVRVAAAAAGPGWDAGLWQALEETGLTLAGSPEEAGGSGGDLPAAAAIAAAAGAAAAPVPLAETLAAGMLLARAGLAIPAGPLTLAVAGPGTAAPASRCGGCRTGGWPRRWPPGPARTATGWPSSRRPAGAGRAVTWPASRGTRWSRPRTPRCATRRRGTADYARRLLRLFRSLLIAGAAQRALDLTVTYVKEREQFGRPLARSRRCSRNSPGWPARSP